MAGQLGRALQIVLDESGQPVRIRRSVAVRRLAVAGVAMGLFSLSLLAGGGGAEQTVVLVDSTHDHGLRPSDPDADTPYDPALHAPIDLVQVTVGRWDPDDPEADLFAGRFLNGAPFVRLDLTLAGLVNPPGTTRPDNFQPFTYGPTPVFGFVEIDMDKNAETGGELDAPQYRYLGNAVRFGGAPAEPAFADRYARDAGAFDEDFATDPFVERHGEEFHLALLGSLFGTANIKRADADTDDLFEADETWQITAPWFHRAHGFEPFSRASGGAHAGEYSPDCTLQFAHDQAEDLTTISLVFPIDNYAAGAMEGKTAEPYNEDPSDQASVLEALMELQDSAVFLRDFPSFLPEEAIITGWETQDPNEMLNPAEWRLTVLLGTSYTAADPTGEYFVWTDIYPNVLRGDVNGDDLADGADQTAIQQYISETDGDDGLVDGQVELPGVAYNFSVFDVNHSGIVDDLDVALVRPAGELDGDVDIDLGDFAVLQNCFSGEGVPYGPWECGLADLDADDDVDLEDALRWAAALGGPE